MIHGSGFLDPSSDSSFLFYKKMVPYVCSLGFFTACFWRNLEIKLSFFHVILFLALGVPSYIICFKMLYISYDSIHYPLNKSHIHKWLEDKAPLPWTSIIPRRLLDSWSYCWINRLDWLFFRCSILDLPEVWKNTS